MTAADSKPNRAQTDNGLYVCFLVLVVLTVCTTVRMSTIAAFMGPPEVPVEIETAVTVTLKRKKMKATGNRAAAVLIVEQRLPPPQNRTPHVERTGGSDNDNININNTINNTINDAIEAAPVFHNPELIQPIQHWNETNSSETEIATEAETVVAVEDPPPRIDWSDDIFKRSGWDNDPVVIESHKLVFFTVPKNACTTFKKLFRRMMGHPDWFHRSPHDPSKNGLRYLGHYHRDRQREMMESREWTRAVFVRDPLERTLSAYMDKALQRGNPRWKPPVEGAHLKQLCCHLKGADETPASRKAHLRNSPPICKEPPFVPYENPLTAENFPFETFVSKLLRPCWDTHWRPQHERINRDNWGLINFVGHFETKLEDTHRLLRRIGAFEEYGAAGWGKASDPETNATRSLSIFETNTALHKTGSSDVMHRHYTETVRKTVSSIFRGDYELGLFNFTNPVAPEPETAVR